MHEVLRLVDVSFVRDGHIILAPLTWKVLAGQRWLVLGANGSGKTTLLRVAAMYEHPSSGDVRVLGEQLGHTDVRVLRRRIGFMSASLAAQLRPALRCLDVVMTAKFAALEPWWHRYDADDEARALLREAMTLSGDLRIVGDTLHVSLDPATAPRRSRALHALCQQLTATETIYPDTQLKIVYSIKGHNGPS